MKPWIAPLAALALIACSEMSSDEHLAKAQEYLQQQDIEAAVVELKNALQKAPRSAQARFELGKLYLQQKDYLSAEKELNLAMEFGYPASVVVPLLSRSYRASGADVALSSLPHDVEGLEEKRAIEVAYFKLESLIRLDKRERSRVLIEEILLYEFDSPYKVLAKGYEHLLNGESEDAYAVIDKLVKEHPRHLPGLSLLARLQVQKGQIEAGIATYKRMLAVDRTDTQTRFVLARLLVDNKQFNAATEHLEMLLELNQQHPLLNQLMALAQASQGNYQAALEYAETAITNDVNDVATRLVAGYSAYQLQNFEASERHLSLIASELPETHPALKLLAASQIKLGRSMEASMTLSQLAEVGNEDAALFSAAGFQLVRLGNLAEAKKLVEQVDKMALSGQELTKLGVLKLTLNDVEGIVDLEKALDEAGGEEVGVTRTSLATAYLSTGNYDKAIKLAKRWKAEEPDSLTPYLMAGTALARQGLLNQARGEFEAAEKLDADSPNVILGLAELDLVQKRWESAEKRLKRILAQKPGHPQALGRLYALARQKGDTAVARQRIAQAFEDAPDNRVLGVLMARVHANEGEYQEAVKILAKVPSYSRSGGEWKLMGAALLKQNALVEARDHYQEWLSHMPNNKDAMLGQALIMDVSGKFAEGLALAQHFATIRPDDPQVAALLTHFALMSGEFELARREYRKLPEAVKESPMGQGFQARILAHKDQCQLALEPAQAAYEAVPNNRNLLLWVMCLERTGNQFKALDALQQHVNNKRDDWGVWMVLAERQMQRNPEQAITSYETVLEYRPTHFVALNNVAYLLLQAQRLDEATKYGLRALDMAPNNPDVLDTLAQIRFAQGDTEQALTLMGRAINQDESDEVYLNYVEMLINTDQHALARRKLEQREFGEGVAKRLATLREQLGEN